MTIRLRHESYEAACCQRPAGLVKDAVSVDHAEPFHSHVSLSGEAMAGSAVPPKSTARDRDASYTNNTPVRTEGLELGAAGGVTFDHELVAPLYSHVSLSVPALVRVPPKMTVRPRALSNAMP